MNAKGAHHNDGRGSTSGSGGKRGSVKNSSRLEAFGKANNKGGADWGDVDCGLLQAVVVAITGLGGAVTIGLSRNRGAHSLTLLLDQDRTTMWYNGDADLDAELREVLAELEALT